MIEPLSREQVKCCIDTLSAHLTYPALDSLHALDESDSDLRQQLADVTQHLEVQRLETYQAVEREHAAKKQLAERDAELDRTMSRMASEYEMDMNEQLRKVRERDAKIAELEKGQP